MCKTEKSNGFAHLTGVHLVIEPIIKALFRYSDIPTDADTVEHTRFDKVIG